MLKKLLDSSAISLLLALILVIGFFDISVKTGEQQFVDLAKSFISGRVDIVTLGNNWRDTVYYEGLHYWPLGPFPGLWLTPAVMMGKALGVTVTQNINQFPLAIGVLLLAYLLARRRGFNQSDSAYLAVAFCGASALMAVSAWPRSWLFAQILAMLFMMLAIVEYKYRKRYWLIGVFLAIVLATRVTAAIGGLFFVIMIISEGKNRIKSLGQIILPIVITVSILGGYNWARFGSVTDQGYGLQSIPSHLAKARDYGLFSWMHIPGNLYYFLLAMPDPVLADKESKVLQFPYLKPNPWGMSVLITTPWVIYLLGKTRNKEVLWLWLTVLVTAVPIFTYYGIGWRQIGYRYALDFYPWLYLILLERMKAEGSLSNRFKLIVWGSCIVNTLLFMSFFVNSLP